MLAQFVGAQFAFRYVVPDQALQSWTVFAHIGHCLLHRGMLLHGHFHFTQLDAVSAHLHLAIDAAFVIDLAVR